MGVGSSFRFYLSASKKRLTAEKKRQALPEVLGGKETILVVEDEEPVRQFVSHVLHEYGYKVRLASNGAEALAVWQRSAADIDLLLTDVVMPQALSGIELAEQLRKDKKNLKVIYTSGYSIELLNEDFRSRTDLTFLPKPYHPQKLAELVRACLDM